MKACDIYIGKLNFSKKYINLLHNILKSYVFSLNAIIIPIDITIIITKSYFVDDSTKCDIKNGNERHVISRIVKNIFPNLEKLIFFIF